MNHHVNHVILVGRVLQTWTYENDRGVRLLMRRATFLPQVWEKIPDKADFLNNLCAKMGAAADTWRRKALDVEVYQVEEFHE